MVKFLITTISLLVFIFSTQNSWAANLTFISDLISTSVISATADHTVTFTVTNQIPAGGRIVITPEAGAFNIPAGMDYTDIDFLVAETPGNYVNRSVGAAPNSSNDGVVITTGASGNITININTSTGISAGNQIKILAGTNAVSQFTGDNSITNPSTVGSYRIDVQTEDTVQVIGSARTFIATTETISISAEKFGGPPTMFNGNPSGDFSHTVTAVEIWLNTNTDGVCKYSTVPDQSYSSMPTYFSNTGLTLHTTVVSNLLPDTDYSYYVRCADSAGSNASPTDLVISFGIKPVPPAGTIPGPVGGPEGAGGPPIIPVEESPQGLPYPVEEATLLFSGLAYPSGRVYILMDGVMVGNAGVGGDSKFNFSLPNITRGVRTFSFYAKDSEENKSSTVNVTFSVISNTGNQITNINIPPVFNVSFDAGSLVRISGFSIANKAVEVSVYDEASATLAVKESVDADSLGRWSFEPKLKNGDYRVRVRSVVSEFNYTAFTSHQSFSVGESGGVIKNPEVGSADLNGDGKVNLIDFSILLFNWGDAGKGTISDLNADDTVNLTDFSILLFNWTG